QRNKIVAGLSSLGVLVIEAGEKSGALITAKLAKSMGKKVYAVPGPINSRVSVGCNNLIKNGEAIMATSAVDILKIKSPHSTQRASQDRPEMTGLENKIYKTLQLEPLDIDEIAVKIGISIVEIGSTLSMMSLKGLITEAGGKYYLRK
ncbi:DNA-processing protein DprA, partial [Patescibacteria group bacterium]|nr:DNA-processing protein DprA [Patescibacteria group bacterium]